MICFFIVDQQVFCYSDRVHGVRSKSFRNIQSLVRCVVPPDQKKEKKKPVEVGVSYLFCVFLHGLVFFFIYVHDCYVKKTHRE